MRNSGFCPFLPRKIFLTCLTCLVDAELMSISGEEIRAARERAHLTQEELAQAVGVSIRTVGNWERGESVPRSRMAAVEQVLAGNMPDPAKRAMLTKLGLLASASRSGLQLSTVKLAKKAGLGSDRTVRMFESGTTTPEIITQRKLEDALEWKHGVIRDLLQAAEDGTMTADDVDMDYVTGFEPVNRASELEDAELLAETIKRLSKWEATLREDPPANVSDLRPRKLTPAQEQWEQFGLSARRDQNPTDE